MATGWDSLLKPHGKPSVDEIVKGQIFLGNFAAAESPELRKELGITHIVSVLKSESYISTGPNHLVIPVYDSYFDNILIHLPKACQFIEDAQQQGGKVLVHCWAGISRSATVVAAYLMKTRKMDTTDAIDFMLEKRPEVFPNSSFRKQLEVFRKCNYDPRPSHESYIAWEESRGDFPI